jgi:predicted dinucleotide-binding enzyme
MKVGILGTGEVGNLIGSKLTENGHEVMMGGREGDNPKGLAFAKNNPSGMASYGTFTEASGYGEIIFNAINGSFALQALKLAETDFAGKINIDVSNPMDLSIDPPQLIPEFAGAGSVGESIQDHYPDAKVVKTLNIVAMKVGIDPKILNNGDHSMLMAGNDEISKAKVRSILLEFGWIPDNIIDIGGIKSSRAMESYPILWVLMLKGMGVSIASIKVIK